MVNLGGMIAKAKQLVGSNPDGVRKGLEKVEKTLNDKTGGKYADQLEKGRSGLQEAFGVPGEAKEAYQREATAPQPSSGPVTPQPVDPPAPIADPEPVAPAGTDVEAPLAEKADTPPAEGRERPEV